jgi:hypothetical protein
MVAVGFLEAPRVRWWRWRRWWLDLCSACGFGCWAAVPGWTTAMAEGVVREVGRWAHLAYLAHDSLQTEMLTHV